MLNSLFRSRAQDYLPNGALALPTDADADKRRDRRWNVTLEAMMVVDGMFMPVHLLDLSRQGALAHSGVAAPSNSLVWVHWQGFESLARVMWARGGRFGLKFHTPLTQAQIDRLVAVGR